MTRITKTSLPGVGVKHEFVTDDGRRVGVIHHRTGKRELFVCEVADPDAASLNLALTDDDSHALSDALGGSEIIQNLSQLQQQIEGLAIGWVNIEPDSSFEGKTIGETRTRTLTGVSIVAVIREDVAVPAPGPEFTLEHGDTLVVVGTAEGIDKVEDLLTGA